MAFSYTVNSKDAMGKGVVSGSYTSTGGSTGGDIQTGLDTVETFLVTPKGSTVATNQSVVNETLPLTNANGTVTIVTDANQVGYWLAIGY